MANVTLKTKLMLRNDTEANWMKANPVLLKGEAGFCSDKQYLKFGDGKTAWNSLPMFNKSSLVFSDNQPDDDNVDDYDAGTIWMVIKGNPPTIYILTVEDNLNKSWQRILTEFSLDDMGIMREQDFARSQGAGANTGYVDKALTADKLKTARTITLTGGVTGAASFDGSNNISLPTTLAIAEKDVPTLPLSKIRDAGTAASRNVGTAANQIPVLDASGKLNTAILPQLAIVDVVEAASDAEMLAKTAQKGDICLRSDAPAGAFILAGDDPKVLANWKRIPVPANAVLSVNGKIGVVALSTDDVPEGVGHQYFSPTRAASYLQDEANTFIMDCGKA